MKKLWLVLAAALLMVAPSAASAQNPPPGERRGPGGPGRMMEMLMQGITLTADQQKKMDSINAANGEQMRAVFQDTTLDREARFKKSGEMRQKHMADLKAQLTDEQKKVFDKNVADMEARRGQMRRGGGGNPPPAPPQG